MWSLISAAELEQYLDEGRNLYLVDMRDQESFARGHIRGAVNIPGEKLIGSSRNLPRDRLIVLYCYRGPQSMLAARKLAHKGYQVADVYGGIQAYRAWRGKYLETG